MAPERLSHSDYRWQLHISNPTFKRFGIDAEYDDTDKKEYFQPCPSGHHIRLNWFKHVVREIDEGRYVIRDPEWTWNSGRDIRPICHKCNKAIDQHGRGLWVPTAERPSLRSGYRLTKLFTGTVPYVEIMGRFIKGITNPDVMQRVYNGDFGEAYTAPGSRVDRDMLFDCVEDYTYCKSNGLVIAGVDVGKLYNISIKEILADGRTRTLYLGEVQDTIETIGVLRSHNVKVVVVDGNPETREARKIINRFKLGFVCYFGAVKEDNVNLKAKTITVQRTPAFDAVKEAILTKATIYPKNIYNYKNFINQMTASTRTFNPERSFLGSKGCYEWVEGNNPDHFMLAECYCLIARRLVVLLQKK